MRRLHDAKCLILDCFFESKYYCFEEKTESEVNLLRPCEQGEASCFDKALDELINKEQWLIKERKEYSVTVRLNKSKLHAAIQYRKSMM